MHFRMKFVYLWAVFLYIIYKCVYSNNASRVQMVNIGHKIKEELVNQQKSVQWLAETCGCSRMTVYRILDKNSVDTNMLSNISRALNHNFFKDLAEDVDSHMAVYLPHDVTNV